MLWSSCFCLCRLVLCHFSLLLHLESARFLFIAGLCGWGKLGPPGAKCLANISYACRWVGSFDLCTFITSKQEEGGHCSFWRIFVLLLSLLPLLCCWLLFRRLLGCSLFSYLLCYLLNGRLFCFCSRLFGSLGRLLYRGLGFLGNSLKL